MSKIMRAMRAAARDAQKPAAERKRYSSDWFDREGYANYQAAIFKGMTIEVRLDGETVKCAVTADELRGLVVCYAQPFQIGTDGELVRVERRGTVGVSLVPR